MAAYIQTINRDRTLHGVTPVLLTGSHVACTTRGYLDATKNDRRLLTAFSALHTQHSVTIGMGAESAREPFARFP